jgi:hypothetical protein
MCCPYSGIMVLLCSLAQNKGMFYELCNIALLGLLDCASIQQKCIA